MLRAGLEKGLIIELLITIVLDVAVRFYHEHVFCWAELREVYGLLRDYEIIQFHDEALLAARMYRDHLVEVIRKRVCEQWLVAECASLSECCP
jgi:hypothetical protein